MRGIFLPGAAALVLFGSVGAAIAQGQHHGGPGGGAGRSPGGGAVHAPGGGGGMRSAPSGGNRAYQAPRAYQERSRRVERSPQRSERSRQAESRRVDRDRQQ